MYGLPRCHSRPSATALSSHAIALRSSSDMNLPYLVSGGRVRAECLGLGHGVWVTGLEVWGTGYGVG